MQVLCFPPSDEIFLKFDEISNEQLVPYPLLRREFITYVIYEHFSSTPFKNFFKETDLSTIRDYLFKLLTAINHLHSKDIIHGNISTENVLFDPATRELKLILPLSVTKLDIMTTEFKNKQDQTDFLQVLRNYDFKEGQNIEYGPAENNPNAYNQFVYFKNRRVSFQAPELFVDSVIDREKILFPQISSSIIISHKNNQKPINPSLKHQNNFNLLKKTDIWSFGAIILAFLSGLPTIFLGSSLDSVFSSFSNVLGDAEVKKFATRHQVNIVSGEDLLFGKKGKSTTPDGESISIVQTMDKMTRLQGFCAICNEKHDVFRAFPQSLFDLCAKCLCMDREERLDAETALKHPFFNK